VILVLDSTARDATLAVAASFLRHIPAEAVYLSVHPADTPEQTRGECLRELLDVRTAALSRHGLDMRTETRFGDLDVELTRELSAHGRSMLVLGFSNLGRFDRSRLAALLEGDAPRPVLIVRPTGTESERGA
jgi:hypothetical protein